MGTASHEQRGRLIEPPLTSSQLTETSQSIGGHARSADRQFMAGVGEFALGFVPGAAPHADRGVLGATDGEQLPKSPLAAVFLDTFAPLNDAGVIPDPIAGADQIAAG